MDGIVEMMNATSFVVERVRRAHPEENVLFAGAATLIHSSRVKLVGISPPGYFSTAGSCC